ncbi:tubulin-like doman-containing protein [Methylomagnum ishizawai]|uniref:tubulin-like doman-containing protein n=1 Tax=Methylomagnum ishizawai TaxID=1760988 RepID=UPI001C327619|nr:tubulin-like doman-containing protein [Methylomagnum ishizawai]BBL73340.1 hypothetical protein MishRS11D_04380 [Methylomagnum ishizawai]
MSNNHLIIGLGGTGGKVIKAFRKGVYEEFRNVEPIGPDGKHHVVHIGYLYVDSSANDLAASERWRTQGDIGALIALNERHRLSIAHNDLQTRLRDREHFPVTHRYIGNPQLWTDIFSQMNVQQAAGGQMRRLGEALFEPQCQAFVDRVKTLCNELSGTSGVQGVSFHVCCGLAGGTGSGAFLHVIAQLRRHFANSREFPIFLYLLLPEPNSEWASNGERTNYYANGYAALQELNAYLLSDPKDGPNKGGPLFTPYDLTANTGSAHRFENIAAGGRTHLLDRLQGCFVLSNINERGLVIGVKNEEIHNLIAQLAFQRIFLIDSADAGQYRPLRDAITLENTIIDDEGQTTDPTQKVRSTRFLSFGLKRLLVPEEEIREHFAASFASQAALQMLYNNWPAETATAFVDEKKKTAFKLDVQKQDKLAGWKLSDEQITLSKGILATEISNQRWKPIQETWNDIAPHLKTDAWEGGSGNGIDPRLDRLETAFQDYYNDSFRGVGVDKLYEAVGRDVGLPDRHVAEICDTVEQWMFGQWQDGTYSVTELETFLDDLIEDLERRLGTIPARLEAIKKSLGGLNERMDDNSSRWAKMGILGRAMGRPGDIFNAQADLLTEVYEKRTLIQAWTFAEKLLRRVVAELRDRLRPSLAEFRVGLSQVNDFFQRRRGQTCQDDAASNVETANVVKFYEPAGVRRFCRSLLELEQMQRSWAGVLRRKAVDTAAENKQRKSGREKGFAMMVQHFIKETDAMRVFEDVARQNAEQAHDERTGPNNRHFGVNIVIKLAEQFADREKLRDYIKTLVRSSLTFMQWRGVEFGGGVGPNSMLAVSLPRCDERASFREELKALFRDSFEGKVEIIDSGRRSNEICLIAFKYVFPLRYLEPVWQLKERYDYRLNVGSRERALLEVHIEDHQPALPGLFRPAPGEAGKRVLPALQIAAALGVFEQTYNDATGQQERKLKLLDADGRPRFFYYPDVLLGLFDAPPRPATETAVLSALIGQLTQEQSEAVEKRVRDALAAEQYRIATAREELKQKLLAQLENVQRNRNHNERDPIYLKMDEACGAAIQRVMAVR